MKKDIWHYSRLKLAKQVLGLFENGLSSALVFFAPRRMGKTEFLLKDMLPCAEQAGWKVMYFSFLDISTNAKEAFTLALLKFAIEVGPTRWDQLKKRIQKVSAGTVGLQAAVEFRDMRDVKLTLKEVIHDLVKHHPKILLLLDEVQVLSNHKANQDFVAAFRTALDVNKDSLKVIFTGSSREGLRQMFSKSDAPFFHFGQNLPFPEFDKDFIEHLVKVYHQTTKQTISRKKLWEIFVEMNKVPQLIRSLVERVILHPKVPLQEAKEQLLAELVEGREYVPLWDQCTTLEKIIIKRIMSGERLLFSEVVREQFAKEIGVDQLPISTVQSAIRSLLKKQILGRLPERGRYYIDDPNFKSWIEQQ